MTARKLFDKIFKRIIHSASRPALVRLLNGIFETDLPPDSGVEFAATESVTETMKQIISDMIVIVGGVSVFHIEAQIGDDADMVVRMFSYGFESGLRGKTAGGDGVITVAFPKAKILYWEHSAKTPDNPALRLVFPDGSEHIYAVETFKVLDYTVEELSERNLLLLFPFYVLKLRKAAKAAARARDSERLSKLAGDMKALLEKLLAALRDGAEQAGLSREDTLFVLDFMERIYDYSYTAYTEFKEADRMLDGMIKTRFEIMEEKKDWAFAHKLRAKGWEIKDIAEFLEISEQSAKAYLKQKVSPTRAAEK